MPASPAAGSTEAAGHYPSALHGPEQMRAYRRAPLVGRWSLLSLRAAVWAALSLRRARRDLKRRGTAATVAPPPPLPAGARRGVEYVLRRTAPTCLERSLVLQTWLTAHDVPCEVVVGVSRSGGAVAAHAWLDVESADPVARQYLEIHRLAPPAAVR